jgi:hypothetical protein
VQLPPQIPQFPRGIDAHGDAIQQRLHGHDRRISRGSTTRRNRTTKRLSCCRHNSNNFRVALGLHGQSVH